MTDAELQRLLVLDDAPGPALAIDAWRANEIIEAALDGAGFAPSGGPSSAGKAGGKASASTGAAVGTKLAIIAAVVIIVAAIVLLMARGRRDDGQSAPPPLPDAAIDSSSGTLAVTPDAAQAAVDPEDIVIDEPPPPPPPATTARPKPKRDDSPADLLGEANAKRAAKQWRESDELYARVVERAPKSLAAQTALIASASLRLEHLGDPKGAQQRFRRALAIAPNGALAEDARWGIAEAARAIGNRTAEAAALDEFLAHHAGSPLAPRAKARRAELP